jgi:N6-adenosine-specific RNA methylase IME4
VQTTEHLLFCRRGTLNARHRIDTTWFEHVRHRHSEKPAMFRQMITDLFGDLPRVELFARVATLGWHVWGNEVASDISLSAGHPDQPALATHPHL